MSDDYDDGGFSGGNMDRPALKRLMADIQIGKVDIVVVSRKRLELQAATEARIAAATQRARHPLRGQDAIGLRVGRFHMAKHFELTITSSVPSARSRQPMTACRYTA